MCEIWPRGYIKGYNELLDEHCGSSVCNRMSGATQFCLCFRLVLVRTMLTQFACRQVYFIKHTPEDVI